MNLVYTAKCETSSLIPKAPKQTRRVLQFTCKGASTTAQYMITVIVIADSVLLSPRSSAVNDPKAKLSDFDSMYPAVKFALL